jgi:hypothetical protein
MSTFTIPALNLKVNDTAGVLNNSAKTETATASTQGQSSGFSFSDLATGMSDLINSGANFAGSTKGAPQTVVNQ